MGCFKRALRESKKTDLLKKIYGIKHDESFTWTEIRDSLESDNLPRMPPPSLIAEGMLVASEQKVGAKVQTKVWRISKDYIGWLQSYESKVSA